MEGTERKLLYQKNAFGSPAKKCVYALTSGSLVFLIVNALLLAIERGQTSVVIPIANISFIMALILSVTLGMERLTRRKVLAVVVAVGLIVLLSQV